MSRPIDETLRRLRFGDLRKLLRSRYGHTLPDDDAGREDLHELLLPVSLGPQAARRMLNVIELHAPWMSRDKAGQLVDQIMRTPSHLRRPSNRQVGRRLRVTNQERELWRLWTIHPCDMTDEEMREQRKAKRRARDRQRRKRQPRVAYLAANSLSRTKPWEIEGISRRTWYRKHGNGRGTGVHQVKLVIPERTPVPPVKPNRRKRLSNRPRPH
jgi:hypothetical protein